MHEKGLEKSLVQHAKIPRVEPSNVMLTPLPRQGILILVFEGTHYGLDRVECIPQEPSVGSLGLGVRMLRGGSSRSSFVYRDIALGSDWCSFCGTLVSSHESFLAKM